MLFKKGVLINKIKIDNEKQKTPPQTPKKEKITFIKPSPHFPSAQPPPSALAISAVAGF